MNLLCQAHLEPYVNNFVNSYGKPDGIKAILHSGSSVEKPLSECIDVDLIMFVKDEADDGTIYIDVDGMRVEGVVIPVPKVLEVVKRELRGQHIALARMIVSGELVFGDEPTFMSPIRRAVSEVLQSARPFFMKNVVGFSSHALLTALKRAPTQAHMTHLAFGILELIGKNEGPIRGDWPMSPKHLLRLLSPEEGGGQFSLQYAVEECVAGRSQPLITYFDAWLRKNEIEPISSFKMFMPKASSRIGTATA